MQQCDIASLPAPANPIGPSSGEVTPRFNHKPLLNRWACDLLGRSPASGTRKRASAEPPENVEFQPPTERRPRRSSAGAPVIQISSDVSGTESESAAKHPQPPMKKLSPSERAALLSKAAQSGLKAQVKKLSQDLSKANAKYEKARGDLIAELSKRGEGWKQIESDNKEMKAMIAQYHTRIMSELGEIKTVVDEIKATPVEIVATQAAPVPPSRPTASPDSTSRPVNLQGIRTQETMPPPALMRESPTRDYPAQRQPPLQYFNQQGYANSSPTRDDLLQQQHQSKFDARQGHASNNTAWTAPGNLGMPRKLGFDVTGEPDFECKCNFCSS